MSCKKEKTEQIKNILEYTCLVLLAACVMPVIPVFIATIFNTYIPYYCWFILIVVVNVANIKSGDAP